MSQFDIFLSSFDQKSHIKGNQFEPFVQWFLTTDPSWSTQVGKIWPFREWPGCWGKDKGIDIIFEHKDTGEIWAVQAKRYDKKYSITKDDVDKFLSESNRPEIHQRLLIATTDKVHSDGLEVIKAQEKPVKTFLYSDFIQADYDYPSNISDIKLGKAKEKPIPRDYQNEAIENVIKGFSHANRGQLIMPCGTGKTYTALWIKEALNADTTLVLIPTLNLLSQTLGYWTSAANNSFRVLCVCSDKTIRDVNYDEVEDEVSFPTTTNPKEVRKFLKLDGNKVIFSTYVSSPVIKNAQKGELYFDLVVADEAHRCAGDFDGAYATVLNNSLIRAKKRLFTTATQRYYSANLVNTASKRGVKIVGMDDESKFGKVFHNLSFSDAINHNPPLLTDYQVVVVGVDEPMIAKWIQNRELLKAKSGSITNAKLLATQIGLIKAIKEYDIKRLITFHNRINSAEYFASSIKDALEIIEPEGKPNGELWADSVSSKISTFKRKQKIKQLKELTHADRSFLSNARCLAEGIDLPSLDGIAFIDPKSSPIDIVQAVGRAIRLSDSKTIGTIILPVFIQNNEEPEQSINESHFKQIWDVVNALRSHDDVLAFELDNFRTKLGKEGKGKISDSFSKIIFDIPQTVDSSFSESLKALVVERSSASFYFFVGEVINFIDENKHGAIPANHKILGNWVGYIRNRKVEGKLEQDRIELLNSYGFVWDMDEYRWIQNFKLLQEFKDKNGHLEIPTRDENGEKYTLGNLAVYLRGYYKKNKLGENIVKKAESMGFVFDPKQADWDNKIELIKDFIRENRHSNIKARHPIIGPFIVRMRTLKVEGKLDDDKFNELVSLGIDMTPRKKKQSKTWQKKFEILAEIYAKDGVDVVLHSNNPKMDAFVSLQRTLKSKGELKKDREEKLNSIGFKWNKDREKEHNEKWQDKFDELAELYAKEGAGASLEKHPHLAGWYTWQRQSKDTMPKDRRKKLDSIGFPWDSSPVLNPGFQKKFELLKKFIKVNGHAAVPGTDKVLGNWAGYNRNRKNLGLLEEYKVELLDSVGFIWDLPQYYWNVKFDKLKIYIDENNKLPDKKNSLYSWLNYQRTLFEIDKLSSHNLNKLNSLVIDWK